MNNTRSHLLNLYQKKRYIIVLQVLSLCVFGACLFFRILPTVAFDIHFGNFVQGYMSTYITTAMIVITDIFDPSMLFVVSLAVSLFFVSQKKYFWAVFFISTISVANISAGICKYLFEIDRPTNQLIEVSGWGFPSGHATGVAVFFFLITYAIEKKVHKSIVTGIWLCTSLVLVVATGVSRVYLGAHATTDVLAGFALGVFWATVGIMCFEYIQRYAK